jgi:hypothetical protein
MSLVAGRFEVSAQEPAGGGTPSTRQIPCAVHFLISAWRGMGASFPVAGLIQMSCFPP